MTEEPGLINRSNTICHYTHFPGFSDPNCNRCNSHEPKMVELLHLFAENGLSLRLVQAHRVTLTLSNARGACLRVFLRKSPDPGNCNLVESDPSESSFNPHPGAPETPIKTQRET